MRETWSQFQRGIPDRLRPWVVFLAAYPVLLPVCLYVTALAAWGTLGHWPRPNLDDPRSLGWAVSSLSTATTLVITAGMGIWAAGWLGTGLVAVLRSGHRRVLAGVLVLTAACFAASIGFVRWDPLSVAVWLAD